VSGAVQGDPGHPSGLGSTLACPVGSPENSKRKLECGSGVCSAREPVGFQQIDLIALALLDSQLAKQPSLPTIVRQRTSQSLV
jgi:hypothetical protein